MHAGFGLGRLHHLFTRRRREEVVLGAIEAGFRHFDLAPAYGDGLAERELGRVLGGKRADVTITTKFGIPFSAIGELPMPAYLALRAAERVLPTPLGAKYGQRDFSSRTLVSSLEDSLRRMRTDYVDYLLVHEPMSIEQFRTLGDAWGEMEQQQRLGKIRKFGVSSDTRMLLDAERENLVPEAAVRMVPMDDVTCGLPQSWFSGREVFVFNIVKYLRRTHGPGRIETRSLIEGFARALPAGRPVLATNNIEELRRMGEAVAAISSGQPLAGAAR
jgi:D-threo-aldose 1-dehydrogenase